MAKLAIFYHVYQYGNWNDLFEEQCKLLFDSGLLKNVEFVHVGVNGDQEIKVPHNKYYINYNKLWTEETPTLKSLQDFCLMNSGWKVLYIHTKGVTQTSNPVKDWRKMMEYFCVEQWNSSLEKLNEHDTVGCLYVDHCYYGYFPHYSGNFWWVNSDYVCKLNPSYLDEGIKENREFWIGTGNGSMFSFYNTGINHYEKEFPRELYAIQ